MKQRTKDALVVSVSLGLLLTAGVLALCLPWGDFSETERRYRAQAPSAPELTRWRTDQETESYLSDRVPLRELLVETDALAQTVSGRRTQLAAWPAAGALLEPPVRGEPAALKRRAAQLQKLAEQAGAPWYLLVPPTHGSLLRGRMNPLLSALYAREDSLMETLAETGHAVALTEAFTALEAPYYRTDHHWTLEGARAAYEAFCAAAGREAAPETAFRTERYPGFRGTTASRSGIFLGGADTLCCAEPREPVTLTVPDSGETYDHLIFPENAESWDGYAVYLNGNHGLLRVENPAAPEGRLMVFRDSFASCLIPLLSASWRVVTAVDARYYSGSFSEALAEEKTDAVLFCYSLDSVMNDTMLARKAR